MPSFSVVFVVASIMSASSAPLPLARVPIAPAIASVVILEVGANVVEPEKLAIIHVLTETISATYCVKHEERAYVQPEEFRF